MYKDYISLAAELVRMACVMDEQPGFSQMGDLMREAAVMIRTQGDELNKLKAGSPYVRCPRCHHMVTKILESGQCGFCDLME